MKLKAKEFGTVYLSEVDTGVPIRILETGNQGPPEGAIGYKVYVFGRLNFVVIA